MKRFLEKVAAGAFLAVAVGFGVSAAHAAAVVVNSGASGTLDGWQVTAANNVTLTLSDNAGTLDVTKVGTFMTPNEGALVSFMQTSSTASADIVFTQENLHNNSGSAWNQFQFALGNTATSSADYATYGNSGFTAPVAAGVSYNAPTLNTAGNILTYTGSQADGTTSVWGGTPGDDLVIDANPFGSQAFAFKELSQNGGSGPVISLPAADWQSLVGLLGLATISGAIALRKRLQA